MEEVKLTNYQIHKEAMERWRVKNQAHVNKYHRDRRAKLKAQMQEERDKQVIKNFLEKQLNSCV